MSFQRTLSREEQEVEGEQSRPSGQQSSQGSATVFSSQPSAPAPLDPSGSLAIDIAIVSVPSLRYGGGLSPAVRPGVQSPGGRGQSPPLPDEKAMPAGTDPLWYPG